MTIWKSMCRRSKEDWARMRAQVQANYQAKAPERDRVNRERFREARNKFGRIKLRIFPSIRSREPKDGQWMYQALLGEAWYVTVPEVVDAIELVQDFGRFLRSWRPRRLRASQKTHDDLLTAWESLDR